MANKDKDHKKLKTVGKSYIILYDEYPSVYNIIMSVEINKFFFAIFLICLA